MTIPQAKELNFPFSWHLPASYLFQKFPFAQLQHDTVCYWTRLKDGDLRFQSYYVAPNR